VSTFVLLPAIDLRDGRVVRLVEGDFERETRYAGTPAGVAAQFAEAGVGWIHVVDLDGARVGEPRQLPVVVEVVVAAGGRAGVELGGGLRSPDSVARALAAGVGRVALGTAALRDPAFARATVERHGADRVVGSIDVRGGLALGEGWATGAAGLPAAEAVRRLADAGIETFEVTAIERDGRLEGPDLSLLETLVQLDRGAVIASGGVTTLEDLHAVRDAGCRGAIVGRAIYEGRLDLGRALRALA
jgi:phosphoribosylformimino-5-aminoimidazole carboxamide ribotide isomerase